MLNQHNKRLIILLQILLLLPFFAICFFLWPSSDDYAMSYLLADNSDSMQGVLYYLYISWGGRFATMAGAIFSPVVVNHLWFYRTIIFLTLAILFLSVRWLMARLIINSIHHPISGLSSGLFLLLWWQTLPGVSESLYWYSGVVVYIWPLAGMFFLWGGLLQKGNTLWHKFGWALVAFWVIGFNEMAAGLVLISVLLAVFNPENRRWKKGNYSMMAVTVMGLILLVASPGNWQRMEIFDNSANGWDAVLISLISLIKLNGIHLQSITLWLSALLLFRVLIPDNFHEQLRYFLKLHPLLVLGIGQGLLLVLLFVPAWSMGINPPLRVYGFLSPLWLLWFGWLLVSAGWYFRTKLQSWPRFTGVGFKAMVFMIALSFMVQFVKIPGGNIVFGGNVPQAWYDLVFRASDYSKQMTGRELIIEKAHKDGLTQLSVPALKSPPPTIFFIDMTSDPQHWINPLYARHYGLETIWVEE